MSAATPADVSLIESLLRMIDTLTVSLEQEKEVNAGLHEDQKRLEEAMRVLKATERETYSLYVAECETTKNLEKWMDEKDIKLLELHRADEQSDQIKQLQIELLRATTEKNNIEKNLSDEIKELKTELGYAQGSYRAAIDMAHTNKLACNKAYDKITAIEDILKDK